MSYEKQIAIIDKIMKRVIEYCKARFKRKGRGADNVQRLTLPASNFLPLSYLLPPSLL